MEMRNFMKNIKNLIMNAKKRIAIISHDDKKTQLIEWSYFNKHLLQSHQIIAAANAAIILEGTLNVPIKKLSPASLGGYQQLNNLISNGEVDIVIFLWNSAELQLKDADIISVLKGALAANLVVAFNKVSADFVLQSALMPAAVDNNAASAVNTTYNPPALKVV